MLRVVAVRIGVERRERQVGRVCQSLAEKTRCCFEFLGQLLKFPREIWEQIESPRRQPGVSMTCWYSRHPG